MAQEFYKEALFARIYLSSHRVRLIFYDFIYIYIYMNLEEIIQFTVNFQFTASI